MFALENVEVRAADPHPADAQHDLAGTRLGARPLDEAQLDSVRDAVAGFVGRPVQLSAAVDPALLGGVVVRVGSRMVDASLKTKLQNLELSMRGIR